MFVLADLFPTFASRSGGGGTGAAGLPWIEKEVVCGWRKKLVKKFCGAGKFATFAARHGGDGMGEGDEGEGGLKKGKRMPQTFGGLEKGPGKKRKKSLQLSKSFLPLQSQTKREFFNGC